MRRLLPVFVVALGTVLAAWPLTAPASPNADAAMTFIQNLADRGTEVVDSSLTGTEKEERLRALLRENFDVGTIGRFALGPHRRRASDDQLDEYLVAFEDFLIYTYTTRFGQYAGEVVEVTGTRPAGTSETDIFVISNIVREDKDPVQIDWRVREIGESISIIDVEVAGTSQSLTYKQEFASVIANRGNGIEGLIAELNEKVAELHAADSED